MTPDDPIEMIWEQHLVGRPVGTHFSEGTSSALVFADETNHLETHAVLGPEIEDSPDPVQLAVAIAAGVALGIGATKAAAKVKEWWNTKRSARGQSALTAETGSAQQVIMVSAIPVEDFASAVDVALDARKTMSGAEAAERILTIMLAAAVLAENMRALAGAHIEESIAMDLQAAMTKLTNPDVTTSLNQLLETNSSTLDAQMAAEFMQAFGGGRSADGQYVPLPNENVKEALYLPRVA